MMAQMAKLLMRLEIVSIFLAARICQRSSRAQRFRKHFACSSDGM